MTRVPSRSHSSKIYYISETFEIGERFSGKFHGNDHNFHSLRTPANQKFWAAAKFRKTLPGLRHMDIFQILDRRFPSVRRESIVNLRRNFDRRSPSRNPSTIVRFEIYPDDPLIDSPFNADVEKAWNKCWSSTLHSHGRPRAKPCDSMQHIIEEDNSKFPRLEPEPRMDHLVFFQWMETRMEFTSVRATR